MKKKVMRLALLLVLPVAAAFVFSAYTGGGTDNWCPTDDVGYTVMYPNPDDCSCFYTCSDGVLVLMSCPDGLLYNPVLSVCDWPTAVDCSSRDVVICLWGKQYCKTNRHGTKKYGWGFVLN